MIKIMSYIKNNKKDFNAKNAFSSIIFKNKLGNAYLNVLRVLIKMIIINVFYVTFYAKTVHYKIQLKFIKIMN